MKKLGFIGLGIMGLPMAINLMKKSGRTVLGFDVSEKQCEAFQKAGGEVTPVISNMYQECDIIFLCLPTNDLVERTIEGIIKDGVQGTIIVDLSSTSPGLIRRLYKKVVEAGYALLDSPVSGGEAGAISGTLVMMCGGEQEVFKQVQSLLCCMGTKATFMGSTGCGSVTKLANNMIVGCNIGAVCEAFAFAVKAGLDPEKLYQAIGEGFAGSAVLTAKAPKIISGDYTASARIAVHQKDLKNASILAEELDVQIPLSDMVLGYMNEMEECGMVDLDHCAIVKVYEKRMGVKI